MSNPAIDAFARLRVSNPTTLFDSQLQYNDQPLLWETVGDGTATHSSAKAGVQMEVAAGESLIRQSRAYVRYQPGKSQLVLMTGVLGAGVAGVTKRLGYFDDDNGFFFELTAAGMYIVRRSSVTGSPVDTPIERANWSNSTYPFNTYSLDFSKSQIFFVDMEWLGTGQVRCGFIIDGVPVIVHQWRHANALDTVYMSTANLPVRYEIVSTTGAADDMYQICSTVQSEGGYSDEFGIPHAASNGITTVAVTTRRAILSIRPKGTFGSITNRATIRPTDIQLTAATNSGYFEVVYGGTLGGTPSWTSAGGNSVVEYDVAGTTVTGGEVLAADYANTGVAGGPSRGGSSLDFLSRLPLVLDSEGANPIALSVVVTAMTGTCNVGAAINWKELY